MVFSIPAVQPSVNRGEAAVKVGPDPEGGVDEPGVVTGHPPAVLSRIPAKWRQSRELDHRYRHLPVDHPCQVMFSSQEMGGTQITVDGAEREMGFPQFPMQMLKKLFQLLLPGYFHGWIQCFCRLLLQFTVLFHPVGSPRQIREVVHLVEGT